MPENVTSKTKDNPYASVVVKQSGVGLSAVQELMKNHPDPAVRACAEAIAFAVNTGLLWDKECDKWFRRQSAESVSQIVTAYLANAANEEVKPAEFLQACFEKQMKKLCC